MRTPTHVLLGLLVVAAVAGCTTSTPGTAGPGPGGSPQTGSSSRPGGDAGNGAPEVANPLDVSRFQRAPCRALSPRQLQELAVGPAGEPGQEVLGMSCDWRHTDRHGSVQITFLDVDGRGLGTVYDSRADAELAFFEELAPIDGYPAVAYGVVDDREVGGCSVAVGVNDEVAYDVSLVQSLANTGTRDPCEVAAQVAGMALETMRGN